NFWVLAVGVFFTSCAGGGWGVNFAPFASSRGVTQTEIGVMLAVGSALALVMTLGMGMVSDKLGPKWTLVIAMLGGASAFAVFYAAHGFGPVLFGICLGSMTAGMSVSLPAAVVNEFGTNAVGRAVAFITMPGGLAGLTAPVVALI